MEDDINASQIWFKEGNQFDFNLGFGCGIFVYNGKYNPFSH